MKKAAPKTKAKANDSRVTNPHSFWPTPREAVLPLLPHLKPRTVYIEPCAGAGDLIEALRTHGHRVYWSCDIEPRNNLSIKSDAIEAIGSLGPKSPRLPIITNPPFSRHNHQTLFEMIRCFSAYAPTWLLLPSTFKNNDYAPEFMAYCHKVVCVGRLKWFEGSQYKGRKDFDWYLFDQNAKFEGTKFYPKLPTDNGKRGNNITRVWIDEAAALDRVGAL